jgi:anti-anti-sigma factor
MAEVRNDPPPDLSAHDRGTCKLLPLQGRVGPTEAVTLQNALLSVLASGKDVTLDCVDLEHLGGAGLQVILSLQQSLARSGGKVTLQSPPETLAKVLMRAGAVSLSGTE